MEAWTWWSQYVWVPFCRYCETDWLKALQRMWIKVFKTPEIDHSGLQRVNTQAHSHPSCCAPLMFRHQRTVAKQLSSSKPTIQRRLSDDNQNITIYTIKTHTRKWICVRTRMVPLLLSVLCSISRSELHGTLNRCIRYSSSTADQIWALLGSHKHEVKYAEINSGRGGMHGFQLQLLRQVFSRNAQ